MNKTWVQPVWLAILCLSAPTCVQALPQASHRRHADQIAGRYFARFGLGHSLLTITPQGTFALDEQGDIHISGYTPSRGTYTLVNQLVTLTPKGRSSQRDMRRHDKEYYAVLWGKRHYLIGPSRMKEFCTTVASGDTSRMDLFFPYYLRIGDEKLTGGTQIPDVPKKWRKYLLPQKPQTKRG